MPALCRVTLIELHGTLSMRVREKFAVGASANSKPARLCRRILKVLAAFWWNNASKMDLLDARHGGISADGATKARCASFLRNCLIYAFAGSNNIRAYIILWVSLITLVNGLFLSTAILSRLYKSSYMEEKKNRVLIDAFIYAFIYDMFYYLFIRAFKEIIFLILFLKIV